LFDAFLRDGAAKAAGATEMKLSGIGCSYPSPADFHEPFSHSFNSVAWSRMPSVATGRAAGYPNLKSTGRPRRDGDTAFIALRGAVLHLMLCAQPFRSSTTHIE